MCNHLVLKFPVNFKLHSVDKITIANEVDADHVKNFYDRSYLKEIITDILKHKHVLLFVISNFFALEGWILSVAFSLKCVFLHPSPPFTPSEVNPLTKSAAMKFLKTLRPELYYQSERVETVTIVKAISWVDYSCWLWPLLVDSQENDNFIKSMFTLASYHGYITSQSQSSETYFMDGKVMETVTQ
mmetsp:Transcript_15225/g.22420  ORF Transcript_15225/g.22420 Transcript_15225/m.22420 type:complete len:186 (+) Transcript_15225:66-623(+)